MPVFHLSDSGQKGLLGSGQGFLKFSDCIGDRVFRIALRIHLGKVLGQLWVLLQFSNYIFPRGRGHFYWVKWWSTGLLLQINGTAIPKLLHVKYGIKYRRRVDPTFCPSTPVEVARLSTPPLFNRWQLAQEIELSPDNLGSWNRREPSATFGCRPARHRGSAVVLSAAFRCGYWKGSMSSVVF